MRTALFASTSVVALTLGVLPGSLPAAAERAPAATPASSSTTNPTPTTPDAAAPAAPGSAESPSHRRAPRDIVDLSAVAPTILHDIRYRTSHNFVGRPIDGYAEPRCLLTRAAATRLAQVQRDVRRQGYTLKVYDCYRPQRAVDHFVRWAKRPGDVRMKREFYPRVDKSRLFADGYIAEKSGHSRASTVDLTLVKLPGHRQPRWTPRAGLQPCYWPARARFRDNSIDMGTGYDCFDTRSHTADPRSTRAQRANRALLVAAMQGRGFTNLAEEWWHYTLAAEPYPNTYFDFPVARRSLGR